MDAEEIIGKFNAHADKPAYTDETEPPLVFIKALNEVAKALKSAGTYARLDVRAGRIGCPKEILPAKAHVMANGTLKVDGLPVDFVVQSYDDKSYLCMYADGGSVLQYYLTRQGAFPHFKWSPPTGFGNDRPSLEGGIAEALGNLIATSKQLDTYGVREPDVVKDSRIEVSSPLKLKRPGT